MAVTPSTNTKTENIAAAVTPIIKTTTENIAALRMQMPACAQKFREQLISNLQQGQQLSLDAAQTWVKAVSVFAVMDLPKVSVMPDMEAVTKYTFDVAADLLSAQRDFALQMASSFVPAKTS
jgi:hypothetical protein